MYLRFSDIINCVSTSNDDPKAISINRAKSFFDLLAEPSEVFEGIEIDARFICDVKPYLF